MAGPRQMISVLAPRGVSAKERPPPGACTAASRRTRKHSADAVAALFASRPRRCLPAATFEGGVDQLLLTEFAAPRRGLLLPS